MAEVVDADVEVDAGGFDGGQPDAGAEGVAGDRGAVAGREQQVTGLETSLRDVFAELVNEVGGRAMVRGSLSLG